MTVLRRITTPLSRLTQPPPDVLPEHVRYYVYWKIFYAMGALGHAFTGLVFWDFGVTFMVYFNIGSVVCFLTASVLLRKQYYRTAYWFAVSELTLHGVASLICAGPEMGFQNFTFMVVILMFIQPFYSWKTSSLMTVVVLTIGVVAVNYALTHPPLYVISEQQIHGQILTSTWMWPTYVLMLVLPFVFYSARAEKELAVAYDESERLLLNILPEAIAKRLKSSEGTIADEHEGVAVLFFDIVGFTSMSQRLSAKQVVQMLNQVIFAVDALVEKHQLEKIKTIGDAYMVAAGVPEPVEDVAAKMLDLALEIRDTVPSFTDPGSGDPLQVRIGVNVGPLVAGVIGHRKFAYDIWGDAVNLASRMESTGEAGQIHLPMSVAAPLAARYQFEPRGAVDVKGKGRIETCFVIGPIRAGDR